MKKEIQLTKEFKTQVAKAVFAIAFFIFVYIIILLLSIVLTGLCIYGGIALIAAQPRFETIAAGIGLASTGVLILIFLLKFIFNTHKIDLSHLVEVEDHQEPELFNMIRDIVNQVRTSFPKKVYLSSEVNASVFYDSSFWSMFLPIKKNLQIGLGLVNNATKEELKAILAHEFGHFSQRTMKVGSYVYNVNQVIYNMLYDNISYENLVQKWANVSWYFTIFVAIAVSINKAIQWIMRKLYDVVNRNYMGLSREMEFHADEIAASVTGYEPLKKFLLRMSFADYSYSNVLNYYHRKISDNIISDNIYRDQTALTNFLAEENTLMLTNGLPDISLEEETRFDKSKLVIKDQWASHPSIDERIKRLEKTGYSFDSNSDTLANNIFTDIDKLQQQVTAKLFSEVKYQEDPKVITTDNFLSDYKEYVISNSFPKIYNGYYKYKTPLIFDLNQNETFTDIFEFKELYSDEKIELIYTAIALSNDIETLKRISDNTISLKTFDYDGVKYTRKNADNLIKKLNQDLDNVKEQIKKNDIVIYKYFLREETRQELPKRLKQLYSELFEFDSIVDEKYEIYTNLINELQFINVPTPFEQIRTNLNGILKLEDKLKKEIHDLLSDKILTTEITNDVKINMEKYTSKTWQYFYGKNYNDDNLDILYKAMDDYAFLLSRKYFLMKKKILMYQEVLINNNTNITMADNDG